MRRAGNLKISGRCMAWAAGATLVAAACAVEEDDAPWSPGASSNPASRSSSGDADDVTAADGETDENGLAPFSFFVTSLAALQALSGSQYGFGGDLRYGETGAGAGLRGADRLCAAIAERSMPGASAKTWRAFLCAADDGEGRAVSAIDRIGSGPWYDRLGRLLAYEPSELLYSRPLNAHSAIQNDLPNEDGVPNHRPDPSQPEVDNHHMLTGCDTQGRVYDAEATCLDWTANTGARAEGRPRVGLSWPRGGARLAGPAAPGGMGDDSSANWMSALTESGCAPGVNLSNSMGGGGGATVGSGGGYGGFYCFALTP